MQEELNDDNFEPTPEMVERHVRWVDEVVEAVWDHWVSLGEVAEFPDLAGERIQVVRSELLPTDRPTWMHPLESIAFLTAAPDVLSEEQKPDYADALRTAAGLGPYMQAQWVSRAMGLSIASVRKYGPRFRKERVPSDPGRTAVYRHFDASGVLLYIGMTNDPDQRFILHRYTARWYEFSDRCDIEWLDTRAEAVVAERDAIHAERPLFNIIGSVVDPQDAEDYLEAYSRAAMIQ